MLVRITVPIKFGRHQRQGLNLLATEGGLGPPHPIMSELEHSVPPERATKLHRWKAKGFSETLTIDLISVAILIGYFLHFALQSLPAHFRGDDMMNMEYYWSTGTLKAIRANLFFWTSFERPLAALYYLPLHHFFDLHAKPYRVVTITLVGAAIPFAYSLARSLVTSRSVAFLAVVAWCYHPRLAGLVFIDAFIYDVLCSLFYLAALACYVGIREKGRSLHPLQLFGCFVLYLCALNSKEMAVTLPVVVLIYELLKYYHEPKRKNFSQWILSDASPALVAGLIGAVYCYAKMYGPDGLYVHPQGRDAYVPHYSWHAFRTANASFFSQLVYLGANHVIPSRMVFAVWASVFFYAFLRRDRVLELMAFWVVITPLPLDFIVPIRGDASLILPFFGWAMIFAKLAADLIKLLSKSSIVIDGRSGVGAATGAIIGGAVTGRVGAVAIGAAAGAMLVRLSTPIFRVVATLIVACALAIYTKRQNRGWAPRLLHVGEKEAHVIEAFHALNLRPRPGSKILLTDNPFANAPWGGEWVPVLIAKVLWNDHSLAVYQEGKNELNAQEIEQMDYILAVHEYKVDVIRQRQ